MSTLTTAQRDALPLSDFASPNDRKFPILDQSDVAAAASLLGKADDPEAVKMRIIAIAKRKKLTLPDAWQSKAAGEPTSSDVHVDTAMNRPRASRYLARLRDLAKSHFGKMATMTAGQFDELMRQARGHAGGKARADSRQAYDPYMDIPQTAPMPEMPEAEMPDVYLYPKADARVHYRQATQIGQQCSACVHFLDDCGACALVEGRIAPDGLCDLFVDDALEDAAEPDDVDAMTEPREVADLCALREPGRPGWRLFMDVGARAFATPPLTMPVLPVPGAYQHPRYGEIVITRARNQHFIDQFNAGVYQRPLPINAEHEPDREGAYGWMTALHLTSEGAVDATVDWTDRGRAAIDANRFRFVSAEWHDAWQAPTGETYTDVLLGAALCTRPYFKAPYLRPLVASERGLEMPDGTTNVLAGQPVVIFHALAPVTSDAGTTPQGGIMAEPQVVALTEDQAREMSERITALEAERDAAKAMAEQASTAATQATERVGALESDARRKRFTDEVMGRSDSNGQRWYGEPDKHVTLLERLAQAFGEDSDEVRQYVEQNRAHAAQLRELVGSEVGRPGHDAASGATATIMERAKAMADKDGISVAQAVDRIAATEPALYAEHRAGR